jgi:hypothetical protein
MINELCVFIESLRTESNTDIIDTVFEAVSILLEEPHIDAPRGMPKTSLINNFSSSDLKGISTHTGKKKPAPIHINNLDQFEAFDLYIEQTGNKRADGQIHEPMRYIRDISLGKAVISPRDNVSIKLSRADGSQFLKWITRNRMAMLSIRDYLMHNPDKVMELPFTFYEDAIKNKTMSYSEVKDLLPAPRGMHESV